MKNFLVITVLFWLCTVSGAHGFAEQPSPYNYITPKCPKVADLMETSSKDKEELLKALKYIVPEVYGDVGYDVWVVKETHYRYWLDLMKFIIEWQSMVVVKM